jgi:hypothetical protein
MSREKEKNKIIETLRHLTDTSITDEHIKELFLTKINEFDTLYEQLESDRTSLSIEVDNLADEVDELKKDADKYDDLMFDLPELKKRLLCKPSISLLDFTKLETFLDNLDKKSLAEIDKFFS